MKSKSSKIFSGLLALVLALTMMVGVMPMSASAAYENTYTNTGNQRDDIIGVAKTQLGYREGANNATKYGTWYGLPNQPWCAMFISWCARQAGIPTSVLKNSAVAAPDAQYFNIPYYDGASYTPQKGDLFFTKSWSHVGLVYYVDGDYFYTIEGNSNNMGSGEGTSVVSNRRKISNFYFGVPNYQGGSTPSHTHSYTSTVTAPTCTSQGYTTHTCSCGDSYTDSYVPALGHSDGAWVTTVEPTCLGEGTEKIYCTRCNAELNSRQIAPLGHDYASEVVTEATCKGKGQMKYVCKRCEFTYYDVIPAKGHNHEEAIWVTTVAPTCTASGEQSAYCPDCNELIETRAVEALGHDDGKWVITSQPGCESKGEETCYCTRCGKVIDSRPTDALGHDDGTWVVVTKPTCREDGQEVLFCTRCGKATDKRTVNALGHDEGVWKIDFEPTANHDGQMSRYCTRCDEVLETKSFKMHTHREGYRETVTEATCTTDGIGGIFCADCGAKYDTYVISALGHDYNDWYMNNNGTHSRTCSRCHNFESENCDFEVTVKEATCTEAGYTTHVCKICGYTYVDGNVDALGHAWGEWVDDGNGETHTRTCSGCGITETEEHHWGEWKLNKDATLFKNGTKTRVCPDCGATETIGSIHTAWLVRIPYTIVLWIGNILKKVLYILSFQWFLPNHGIPPIH